MKDKCGFIIPFAKQAGITSFFSMQQVKKILHTGKVGHTGTLDSFADGLLVLLSGKLTKLAALIEKAEKNYRFVMRLGSMTDTLDPCGETVLTKPMPACRDFICALKKFNGNIIQLPPVYSALKIDGRRASDRVRAGEDVNMKPRMVYIKNILVKKIFFENGECFEQACGALEEERIKENMKAYRIKEAELSVCCSKGTYIRALARDIAEEAGSCAHITALRRTGVGIFSLEEAAGFSLLPAFSGIADKAAYGQTVEKIPASEIEAKALRFTPELASKCGISRLELKEAYKNAFLEGRYIKPFWFSEKQGAETDGLLCGEKAAVFCGGEPAGIIEKNSEGYKYAAVF